MQDLTNEHSLLTEVLREAGAIALHWFRSDDAGWTKEDGTPVSRADLAVNEYLKRRLTEATPHYGWLSEETEDTRERLNHRRVWVVDPIDGTRAFLDRVPHFCHSVALVEEGRPVLAAVYNPANDEFYEAVAGQGARLNGRSIAVSECGEIEGCRMAAFEPLFRHPAWKQGWPPMQVIQRDSVAYRLVLVASGEVDAAFGLNSKRDWDFAAADLIIHEAGGRFSRHDGTPMRYNSPVTRHPSFMAAGPALYAALFARVGSLQLPSRPRSA